MLTDTSTCFYNSISNLDIFKPRKLAFEKKGHTKNSDKSFITPYDIVHLHLDPFLVRLPCQLWAEWAMLIR